MEQATRTVKLARPGLVFFTGLGGLWLLAGALVTVGCGEGRRRGKDLDEVHKTTDGLVDAGEREFAARSWPGRRDKRRRRLDNGGYASHSRDLKQNVVVGDGGKENGDREI
jgi:hypothetical protein